MGAAGAFARSVFLAQFSCGQRLACRPGGPRLLDARTHLLSAGTFVCRPFAHGERVVRREKETDPCPLVLDRNRGGERACCLGDLLGRAGVFRDSVSSPGRLLGVSISCFQSLLVPRPHRCLFDESRAVCRGGRPFAKAWRRAEKYSAWDFRRGNILVLLGDWYRAQFDFDKAEDYYQLALPILQEHEQKHFLELLTALNNLGVLYYERAKYVEAEIYFRPQERRYSQRRIRFRYVDRRTERSMQELTPKPVLDSLPIVKREPASYV